MPKPKKIVSFDQSFYRLAAEITRAIENNKTNAPEHTALTSTQQQKLQVEELLLAEKKFKETIISYKQSTEIYKKFLQKICLQNKNILSARPFFREPSGKFKKEITPAIRADDIQTLKTFDINYQLIRFIRNNWLGPFPKKAQVLYERVHIAREILLENNLPLAINRAKIFYNSTPRNHLEMMDFIEICALGLAAGVDKFIGEYSPVFRSVCIGRMVGYMINDYSQTSFHFYPKERKILYRANSIRGRQGIEDINELTDAVNKSFEQDKIEGKKVPKGKVTVSELSMLMNTASTVSADSTVNDEGYGVYQYTADTTQDIEGDFVKKDATMKMLVIARELPVLHRKILKLKGVKI